ncbi:hypothetical protein HNV11_15160 [Spirosoma taeanense]|uniref:Uncharacterized protein n=1 Tax=Spirosoma taeanense TaxID=2735870 RepID=A0A6M5YBB1_9BACT|nr:hypothetical protein [Spirosoma taeanense]QJW90626.1 hypothetical protein HNV11_15160 [Spirosoma taeanense]
MSIELSTATETAPIEILDFQITTRQSAGSLLLSLCFLCRKDRQDNQLKLPPLSWFDASQIQQFSQQLAAAQHPETVEIDLIDAGVRLTGSVRRIAGHWNNGRTIRIEPLPSALKSFAPFTIQASNSDLKSYAGKLYSRLWEVFTRG